ncbi:MAG TPA: type II toxin-antitoxin system RelE/ParE family toxin [Candidatus Binataceae bacterium]|nr:type II toxin-antitoxin system RelE/ParE family toxin [Candidatus Binataceae bacterium]
MPEVLEYIDRAGRSPFRKWFDRLDSQAAAKVSTALNRIALGNLSSAKGVGASVFEFRLDFGPGYRIYFGKDGDKLIILLGGGTKARQQRDIESAISSWQDYGARKEQSEKES